MLSNGIVLTVKEALYYPRSERTLMSFRDIRDNQYHVETTEENGSKFLCITSYEYGQKRIHEKLERLKSSHMHHLHPYVRFPPCKACSLGKLNTQPSITKILRNLPKFLQRIQGDICGPIQPTCRPFRYFMVLVDVSTRWSHVCLLSTRNATFVKLLAQIIKLRAHHPDYALPLCTKMGPQRRMRIYVGYDSPSITRYLKPLTGDFFTTRFADCHFDETVFPSLGGDKHASVLVERCELSWYAPTMSHLDPRTAKSKTEVRYIIDLHSIAQSMPYAFIDLAKVMRSHIPTANAPVRIDVPRVRRNTTRGGQIVPKGRAAAPSTWLGTLAASQSSAPTLKCGRHPGSKVSQPQKRKMAQTSNLSLNPTIAFLICSNA